MSQPLWINADSDTSVGTATIESDDNLFTVVGHSLEDGDRIVVSSLTGGAVGTLAEDGIYWVRDTDTDVFAVAKTQAGLPVEFGTDGGAAVNRFEPALDASELRQIDSGLLTKDGARFGARSGVHPGNEPAVTVNGTTWTVENITGVLYPGLSIDDGPYRFAHPEESGSLDPADGSNNRIDAVDLEVQDHDQDASGERRVRVVYESGTAAADPDPPAEVTGRLRLATILVPSGGSPDPSVQTQTQRTVAAGGILPVRNDAEGPAAGRYRGMIRYRQDADCLEMWNGSEWVFHSSPGGWFHIAAGEEQNSGAFDIDLTGGGRFPAGTFSTWKMRMNGRVNNGTAQVHVRVNDISTSTYRYVEIFTTAPDNTVAGSSSLDSSQWYVADWGSEGGLFNPAEFTMSVISGGIVAQWQSTDLSSNRKASYGGGRHDGGVVPTKLTLLPGGGGTEFTRIRWEVEGYITPDFEVPEE